MLAGLEIAIVPLPYEEALPARPPEQVELVVVHCTETPDLAAARRLGERILYPSGTGASGHFYIDRDGRIEQWVNPLRIAHHVRGHNTRSIGIELVNRGRFPHWYDSRHQRMDEPYSEAQITALIALLIELKQRFPGLHAIAGHEDLDRERIPASDDHTLLIARKLDPGPLFPWARVLAATGLERLQPNAP